MSLSEMPQLASFVARVIRNPAVTSIRLREGDNRARLVQRGRIVIDATTPPSAAELNRQLVERVDALLSSETVHCEAMSASDAEIIDLVACPPTRVATPTKEESVDSRLTTLIETLVHRQDERELHRGWHATDEESRLLKLNDQHHAKVLELTLYIQELENIIRAGERHTPMDPTKAELLGKLIDSGNKMAMMFAAQLGILKKKQQQTKALTASPAPPTGPDSDQPPAPSGATPEPTPAGPSDALTAAGDAPLITDFDATEFAPVLDDTQVMMLQYAGVDPVAADQVAEFLIDTIVRMMPEHKDAFTTERLMRLMPFVDMGAIMGALGGGS